MKKRITIITGLIVAFAWHHGAKQVNPFMSSANATEVEIYTASYCSDCKRAKAYLNAHAIVFDEHDVEHDLVQRRAFYARGGKSVPLLFVKWQMTQGFNVEQLA